MDIIKTKNKSTNTYLKIMIIIIALFALVFLSYPAKAETGNITAIYELDDGSITYFGASVAGVATSYDKFRFDTADYNTITRYIYHQDSIAAGTFPDEANSTTFTITSGGTGSGYVSYDKSQKNITWTFASGTRITSSPFTVTYAQNIFASWAQTSTSRDDAMSATVQMCLATDNNKCAQLAAPADFGMVYFLGSATTINYTITYPVAGSYQAFVDKSGSAIANNATLHSQTVTQFSETSYNKVNYTIILEQLDGIYINLSMANGGFEDVLINSSGTAVAVSPNASDPNNPNCNGYNCIISAKPRYNNTESVNIYGSFYPSNGTLTSCLFFGFICEDTVISLESDTGYVFISTQGSTSPVKFLSFLKDQNNNYNLFTSLDIGTYQAQLYGFAPPGTGIPGQPLNTCSGGVIYDFPFIPLGCYYPHNITTFEVVNQSGNLSIVWQTKLSNNSAIYGDTITVSWNNVTANDTIAIYDENRVLLQKYNINQSTVKQIPVFIPLYHVGTFNATIFNGSNILHNASANLNVLPPGAAEINNSYGITMYWGKTTGTVDTPSTLFWNTGSYSFNYTIQVSISDNSITPRVDGFVAVPGQEQQNTYTLPVAGTYTAKFLDRNGSLQQQADIFIAAPVATAQPPGGGFPGQNGTYTPQQDSVNVTCSFWDGLVGLFFMPQGVNDVTRFEFAVAIMVVFGALIAAATKSLSNGVYFSFLPYAFFLFLSMSTPCGTYIPTWTAAFIALITIAKLRWF